MRPARRQSCLEGRSGQAERCRVALRRLLRPAPSPQTGRRQIRRKLRPLAFREAQASFCLGPGPFRSEELRRPAGSIALLAAVGLLVALAPSASASVQFDRQWGEPTDGSFRSPDGIATDSSGNVYVADASNNRIQKFDSSGSFLARWGGFGSGDGQLS